MKQSAPNLRQGLTAQQQRVLQIIKAGIASGNPPTRREIASAMGFRSGNAADEHVRALADLGHIIIEPGKARNIRLASAGHEPVLDDVQIERGLAEIGVYVWGQRGEDWLAGAEYAARILRGGEANPAAAPLQNHPDAAVWPVTCRVAPAAPPTLRRDDTGGASEARRSPPAHEAQEVQVDHETAGPAESGRPAITLQVMQEALRLMPSDEARRVAREAEAVAGTVTPEQYVGAGAVEVIAKLCAPVADERGLLPCPFCGSEAFATFKTGDDDLRRHSVHCKSLDCGGQTRDRHFSEAKAIAAWNRRAALASAPVAAPSDETLRLAGVIADKIEDGTLFQAGILSRRDLADKVRAVVRSVREAGAPVADTTVRQYHYRMPNCTPGRPECRNGNGYPECPCWHDVGTGPLAGKEATATDWRDKPSAPVAGEAQPVIHQHGFASDNQKLRAINESLDKELEQVVTERDEYHDMADKLANAIADHLLVEIGEHSSSNCPWMRALDAIQNAAPQASAEALDTLTITIGWDDGSSDDIEVHGTAKMLRRLQVWMDRKHGLYHDTAPASAEDVRNAALEEAARICFDPQDADRIRALKPQVDKDGGQQRAALTTFSAEGSEAC